MAHRQVESLLLAVLEHVPLPVVVVDRDERLRATSASADEVWGAQLDAPLAGVASLRDLAPVARAAIEQGTVAPQTVPDGFGAAVLDEPGTDAALRRRVVDVRGRRLGVGPPLQSDRPRVLNPGSPAPVRG